LLSLSLRKCGSHLSSGVIGTVVVVIVVDGWWICVDGIVLVVTQESAVPNEISCSFCKNMRGKERLLFPKCKFKWAFMICSPTGRHFTKKQTFI